MALPNFPYLKTDGLKIGQKEVFARIPATTFVQVPNDVLEQFKAAINGSRSILPSNSQGKSGIKSLVLGGYEVKINGAQRLSTSSGTMLTENGCLVIVFDQYHATHV